MSVLLVVPPFHPLDRPAIGVSLLKAALTREGVPCEVLYLNVRFAELVGRSWYARIGEDDLSYMGLIGEWLFAADLFGDRAPEPGAYLEQILRPHAADDLIVHLSELRPRVPSLLDDARTERELLDTLRSVAQDRTTITITHRLSLAAAADHVLVLADGRLVEEGSHAELVRTGGLYRRLYEEQAGSLDAASVTARNLKLIERTA